MLWSKDKGGESLEKKKLFDKQIKHGPMVSSTKTSTKGQRTQSTRAREVCYSPPLAPIALFLFLVVVVLVIAMASTHYYSRKMHRVMREPFGEITDVYDPKFADPALSFPSKCFSCEAQFPVGERWRGQQTKCFACEQAALAMERISPQFTHPNKCFACE